MPSNIRQDLSHVIVHEIIFSTADQPKLLSQLSVLLSGIGLNIREAFVFSTTDGYSLDIFFVDGWPEEATDSLDNALEQSIARNEWLFSVSCHRVLENVISGQPSCDWEIDIKLLKIGEKIASVSCGDLYHGLYLGEDVAVKVFRLKQLNQPLKVEFNKEFSILRQVQHINVVRFIGACTELPHLCLVTEYMHRGSLYDFLHKHHFVLELPLLLKFAIDICKGMDYLHQNNIIHRDLKTANLLMGANNVVKVADFGVARFQNTSGDMTAETGTYKWMAPEVMNHQPYNHKVDIYSFAIVLWELTTSKIPYNELTPIQAAFGVMKGERPELPRNVHPRLLGLMQSCWDEAPARRPSFSQIAVELEELLRQVQLDHGETSQEVRERSSESTE
uniref:Serine/threonine-protein kinase HT1 n=1 Tax=Anthurium amnicola TaxID=1678845 RepID=A0A1D1XSL8_9ARAE